MTSWRIENALIYFGLICSNQPKQSPILLSSIDYVTISSSYVHLYPQLTCNGHRGAFSSFPLLAVEEGQVAPRTRMAALSIWREISNLVTRVLSFALRNMKKNLKQGLEIVLTWNATSSQLLTCMSRTRLMKKGLGTRRNWTQKGWPYDWGYWTVLYFPIFRQARPDFFREGN